MGGWRMKCGEMLVIGFVVGKTITTHVTPMRSTIDLWRHGTGEQSSGQRSHGGSNIWSDLPQMGQIWDFLRSVSEHFGSPSQNVLNLILKSLRFVPFEANLNQFWCQIWHPYSSQAGGTEEAIYSVTLDKYELVWNQLVVHFLTLCQSIWRV